MPARVTSSESTSTASHNHNPRHHHHAARRHHSTRAVTHARSHRTSVISKCEVLGYFPKYKRGAPTVTRMPSLHRKHHLTLRNSSTQRGEVTSSHDPLVQRGSQLYLRPCLKQKNRNKKSKRSVTYACTMPSSNPSQLYALGVLPFISGGRKTVTRPSITQLRENTLVQMLQSLNAGRIIVIRRFCALCPGNPPASNLARCSFPDKK